MKDAEKDGLYQFLTGDYDAHPWSTDDLEMLNKAKIKIERLISEKVGGEHV